jgi:hypothetical protein
MITTSQSRQNQVLHKIAGEIEQVGPNFNKSQNARMCLEAIGAPASLICKVVEIGMWGLVDPIMNSSDFTEHWHRVSKVMRVGPDKWSEYLVQGILPEIVRDLMPLYEAACKDLALWQQLSLYYTEIGDLNKADTYREKQGPEMGNDRTDLREYWRAVDVFRAKYKESLPNDDYVAALKASAAMEIRELIKVNG